MSKSSHQIAIKGVDQTAGAFASVKGRAKAASASIRAAIGGALAAAGAYLSVRAVGGAVKELGAMSDAAMRAGMSVEFLTKATTAFQVAGLNITTESLTKAMQFMQKNTGKQGEGAFFQTAKEIAAIPDAAERAKAAVAAFGRSGMELLPLVNSGQEAIDKFLTLQSLMPGISSAAANAGDAAADALTIFGKGAHNLFLRVVGDIVGMWSEDFPGGVRAGALNAINYLETFLKKAKAWIARVGAEIGALGGLLVDVFTDGPAQAWKVYEGTITASDADFKKRMDEANASREDYVAKLREVSVDDLANAFGKPGAQQKTAEAGEAFGVAAAKRISNSLIAGGSNQANKLAILGPQYQNEQKKTNELLEKVVKNTEKTAENTEGEDAKVTDL